MDKVCSCGEDLVIFKDGTYCCNCGKEIREYRPDAVRKEAQKRTPIIDLRSRLQAKQKKEKMKPMHDRDNYVPRGKSFRR